MTRGDPGGAARDLGKMNGRRGGGANFVLVTREEVVVVVSGRKFCFLLVLWP